MGAGTPFSFPILKLCVFGKCNPLSLRPPLIERGNFPRGSTLEVKLRRKVPNLYAYTRAPGLVLQMASTARAVRMAIGCNKLLKMDKVAMLFIVLGDHFSSDAMDAMHQDVTKPLHFP